MSQKVTQQKHRGEIRLSPSEEAVLDRLAAGDKVADVAAAWGVSSRSVYRIRSYAWRKLGAKTDLHGIAIWVSMRGRPS